MGASASKTAQSAGNAARQYPKRSAQAFNAANATRTAPPPPSPSTPGPTVKPPPRASATRDAGINLDASDPDLARHLRSIGPVQPNPTLSQTSTFNSSNAAQSTIAKPRVNPAIMVLEARARLQEQADKEIASAGRVGRRFLDAYTINQILMQRDQQGYSAVQIEKNFSLKAGTVAMLGPPGMIGLVTEVGRAREEIEFV